MCISKNVSLVNELPVKTVLCDIKIFKSKISFQTLFLDDYVQTSLYQ